MPLPDGWEWLGEIPEEWVPPFELKVPTKIPWVNLIIRMLSQESILGNDVVAWIGRFVTEKARFSVWFLQEAKGKLGPKELALLSVSGQDGTRRVYEAWCEFALAFEASGGIGGGYDHEKAALISALGGTISELTEARSTTAVSLPTTLARSTQTAPGESEPRGATETPTVTVPFGPYTDRARAAIDFAYEQARSRGHLRIETEHLLLGLIDAGHGVAIRALVALGVPVESLRHQVEEILGRGNQAPDGDTTLSSEAKKALYLARREATELGHSMISTDHVLLGLLRLKESVAAKVLMGLGVTHDRSRDQAVQLLSAYSHGRPASSAKPVVDEPSGVRRVRLPAEIREYVGKIVDVRLDKEAAIGRQEFDQAAVLRDSEKQLLAERSRRIREWLAGVDVVVLVDEVDRLYEEVDRMRAFLSRQGFEADDESHRDS